MPYKIKINSQGEKRVKLNSGQKSYTLQYDWPMNTVFNLNGVLDEDLEDIKKLYKNHGLPTENICSIEVFTDVPNVESFFGAEGNTLKECEDIAWKKYQSYLHCNHKFSRNSPSGEHYTNGAGFCIHCGMFKSKAFEPETICDKCKKNENLIPLIDGTNVCKDCYLKTSWNQRIGVSYFNDDKFLDYLRYHNCILEKYEQTWTEDNEELLEQTFTILRPDKVNHKEYHSCHVTWKYKKIEAGLYEVKDYISSDNFYSLSRHIYGEKFMGNYYVLGKESYPKLQEKLNKLQKITSKRYYIEFEIESLKKILEGEKNEI